jgi:hypothetical protein
VGGEATATGAAVVVVVAGVVVVVVLGTVVDVVLVVVVVDDDDPKVNEPSVVPVPNTLVPTTETVPLPAGTVTVAEVAVGVPTTVAALPPKEMVAFSSPRPVRVTVEPGVAFDGEIEVISGHDSPCAIGEPTPVAKS